ncbi:MAG TPA: hypothetical protein VFK38_07585 [Candidatus Limnocylindrales bacterium]|nr:hypothetical protein [Candidatus Limnocylindrales bacterium]
MAADPIAARGVRPPITEVDPSQPHDTCVRCGRPTPLGVSLCEADNPGAIGAPSATQVHGTIFVGVVVGFILLAIVASLALGSVGPFAARIAGAEPLPDGSLALTVEVVNQGRREARATCRVTRGGVSTADDLVFATDHIPATATAQLQRTLPPPSVGRGPYDPAALVVRCS